jgi:hypothetical protein
VTGCEMDMEHAEPLFIRRSAAAYTAGDWTLKLSASLIPPTGISRLSTAVRLKLNRAAVAYALALGDILADRAG